MAAAGVAGEIWTRLSWNPQRGTPGFFVYDPERQQRLAPGYSGWFAGVPVHINSLGFRDDREYALAKAPNTFRILVLGDSVTFGHGSVWEHTYPFMLEQHLREYRPDIDWQVWNAAVPGYNTSQELVQLREIGPVFKPDLVVVGFFENDVIDNRPPVRAGSLDRIKARIIALLQRHVYSLELYKKAYLQLAWRLSASNAYRLRFEHVGTEELLISRSGDVANLPQQQLTATSRWTDEQVAQIDCPYGEHSGPEAIAEITSAPGWPGWQSAVDGFKRLNDAGRYRVMFFLNVVPQVCHPDVSSAVFDPDGDVFYDGGSSRLNALFANTISPGIPTVSAYDEFLHRRPSQMPLARGHSLGNSNAVKAQVLFDYLRDRVLPDALPSALSGSAASAPRR